MKPTIKTKSARDATRKRTGHRLQTKPARTDSLAGAVRSVLVPIDFSTPAEKALSYAVSMAKQFGAKLTLLNVVEPMPTPDFAYYPLVMEDDEVVAKTKQELEKVQRKAGVAPELVEKILVRHGVPYREIVDAARTLKIDLIVISTHGYTGIAHAFMGSTAERVVRHAECPVLVVRGIC